MANEKVSQMVSLTAAEVASDDLFLIVDTSAKESKKINVSDVLAYLEATGSFMAAHATLADTASFIQGTGVFGQVASASLSQTSVSASHALRADNAITAAFALAGGSGTGGTTIVTGSTYPITASSATSASYAVNSTFASSSNVALSLKYTGGNNGTASYSITSSNAITSSYAFNASTSDSASNALSSNTAVTASFALNTPQTSLVKAYAWVTWSSAAGKFVATSASLYRSYNISSFEYQSTFTTGSISLDFFLVQFTTPMTTDAYVYVGNVLGFNLSSMTATSFTSPYQPRDTNQFTCSVLMNTSQESNFYQSGTLTFEVLSSV